ncbi:MAG: nucleotide exchange factor GrpE [Patescibacteria group bacterium]|nr:nucleotide exchange factor GrpE [Patescibacteria group bacterium]
MHNTEKKPVPPAHSPGHAPASPAKETASAEALHRELHEALERAVAAEKLAEENLQGWKRAKADYQNLKRETDQRCREIAGVAGAEMILKMLPVYDNLRTADRHIPAEQQALDWVVGLQQIIKSFGDLLHSLGVEPIPTVGEPFDPSRHEAVAIVPHAGSPSQTIVDEVKPGYTLHGKVLVPAKVMVAK